MVQDFRTQTEFITCNNVVKTVEKWPVALDIGYSAVKGMTPCSRFRFPSFARQVEGDQEFIKGLRTNNYLMYKNADGEMWKVGEAAYQSLSANDTQDDSSTLYAKDRYFAPMFKVIVETALAFACMKEGQQVKLPIVVQTGLPPKYIREDSKYLKAVFSGKHHFWIKQGNAEDWQEFNINISDDNIFIMSQPSGSLMGVALDNDAKPVQGYEKYFETNTLVFDAGFGTLDIFEIVSNTPGKSSTFDDCGMKAVFEDTIQKVEKDAQRRVPIHVFQNVLKDGFIKVTDRATLMAKKMSFEKILDKSSATICRNAMRKVSSQYDLTQYNYLIVTGGTGEVWGGLIKDMLKGIETMTVVFGNVNDSDLSQVYSNVRGYYLAVVNSTATKAKKRGKMKNG